MTNNSGEEIGKLAGSQNEVTDVDCAASIVTAYPGIANLISGPYSGKDEYVNEYKYVSPPYNPGIRSWYGVKGEKAIVDFGKKVNSYIPTYYPYPEKLYSVDTPYNTYLTRPLHGGPYMGRAVLRQTEQFTMTNKFFIHLIIILAIIYIIYHYYHNK